MKNADAAAIRKKLGCFKRCQAAGPVTHHRDCPAFGKWLDEVPAATRSREASVSVSDLEALVLAWGPCGDCPVADNATGCPISSPACAVQIECARELQTLIDKHTP